MILTLQTQPKRVIPAKEYLLENELRAAVEALLSEREGRVVNVRDYNDTKKMQGYSVARQDFWADVWTWFIDDEIMNGEISDVYWDAEAFAEKIQKKGHSWALPILNAYTEVLRTVFTDDQLEDVIPIKYYW